MKILLGLGLSLLISIQASADCETIKNTLESTTKELSAAVINMEAVANEISVISQKKDQLCLQVGRIQANATVAGELIVGSLGPVVSLKCIRRDAEVREQILDNVYHLYTYANNLNDDCLNRRTKEEVLQKVTDGREKLINLLTSLEEEN